MSIFYNPIFPHYKGGLGCGYTTLEIIFMHAYACKPVAYSLEAALSRMASTKPGMVYSLALMSIRSPISSAV